MLFHAISKVFGQPRAHEALEEERDAEDHRDEANPDGPRRSLPQHRHEEDAEVPCHHADLSDGRGDWRVPMSVDLLEVRWVDCGAVVAGSNAFARVWVQITVCNCR